MDPINHREKHCIELHVNGLQFLSGNFINVLIELVVNVVFNIKWISIWYINIKETWFTSTLHIVMIS